MNQYPDLTEDIYSVYDKLKGSAVLEVQQRACEYMALSEQGADIMATVLERMPAYEEEGKESVLETMAETKEASKDTSDKASWKVSADEKMASREHSKMNPSAPVHAAPPAPQSTYDPSRSVPSAPPGSPARPRQNWRTAPPPPSPGGDLCQWTTIAATRRLRLAMGLMRVPRSRSCQLQGSVCHGEGILYDDCVTLFSQAEYRAHQGRLA